MTHKITKDNRNYLLPTRIIDAGHNKIIDYARSVTGNKTEDAVARAVKLYYAVRDGIWYDPYSPFYLPEHYRASNVLERGRGYCVGKASLLCALGRACGIPSRVGFADVKNHLATRQLIAYLGTDLFVYHGYVEFYLEGQWVKATPAFNIELCEKHNVRPLEFDGRRDSLFQPYSIQNKKFMEYLVDHGTYADIPVDVIVAAWKAAYGDDRVEQWIQKFEKSAGTTKRNFYTEDVWKA
jgi:transglutaminase-like putative cysteine protease